MFLLFSFFPFLIKSWEEVDCGAYNVSCSSDCFIEKAGAEKAYCIDSNAQGFCMNARHFYIITLVCTWVPTIIGIIIRLTCLRRMKPPIFSYFYDIFMTFFIVTFVEGIYCITSTNELVPNIVFIFIGFLGFPIFSSLWLCAETKCCCHDPETYPHYIRRFLKQKLYQKEAAETIITEARQNPPVVQLIGNQHIYHRFNNHSWTEIVPVEHDTLPYESWEERGELVKIPDASVVSIRMKVDLYKSAELQEVQKEKWIAIETNLKSKFDKWSVEENDFVDKYVESFMVSMHDEAPCCVKFSLSCFGRFIYYFLHTIGFHSIYETIWCLYLDMVFVKLEKYLDEGDQYRAKANEKDDKALTFEYEKAMQA